MDVLVTARSPAQIALAKTCFDASACARAMPYVRNALESQRRMPFWLVSLHAYFRKNSHRSPLLAMAAPATPAAWTVVEEFAAARELQRLMVPRSWHQ